MPNWHKGLDGRELSMLLNSFYEKSKEKRLKDTGDDDEPGHLTEGYRMLSGNLKDGVLNGWSYNSAAGGVYDNVLLPAWKSFAPTHGGAKQPCPIIRASMPSREPLAFAIQELVRYSIEKFNYTETTMLCGMDAFFAPGGTGYARHRWNDAKGIAETTRFDPKNVYWDATASSMAKAAHVTERHVVPRYEFIKKFGKAKGWDADATKDSTVAWPKTNTRPDGKTVLDKIEYFLCWSKEDGYKRVYAFTKKAEDGILNKEDGEPGEAWPIDLAEGDWHLTPLVFTPMPGRIEGVGPYWAGRDQYLAFQRLNQSVFYSCLKSSKVILFYPDTVTEPMKAVEMTGKTITTVPYNAVDFQAPLSSMIEKWEMPEVSKTLLMARAEALEKWRNTIGVNAAQMIEAQQLETATEAKTLQDAAANMLADDQGAVERFVTEIFRKEIFVNLSRMPKRSVLCVKTRPRDEGQEDDEEGEFEDEPGAEDYEGEEDEEYIFDVPYEEAVQLEKGPESIAAAGRIAKARQKMADKAAMQAAGQGMMGPELEAAQAQAVEQVPQTPEMAARAARGIPMDAVVRIVNPGAEQFIGPEAAAGWEEGMSPRQIEAEIGVSVERGSSSATGRMQNVNEVLMLFNALVPVCQQFGLYKPIAELINAAIKKSEIADLDRARVSAEEIEQFVQEQQQAAQQAAEAEAAAKAGADQGSPELSPDVAVKADAEKHKTDVGFQTQQEKTKQQELKLQSDQVKGDAARDRTRSQAQLQMAQMDPVMP